MVLVLIVLIVNCSVKTIFCSEEVVLVVQAIRSLRGITGCNSNQIIPLILNFTISSLSLFFLVLARPVCL